MSAVAAYESIREALSVLRQEHGVVRTTTGHDQTSFVAWSLHDLEVTVRVSRIGELVQVARLVNGVAGPSSEWAHLNNASPRTIAGVALAYLGVL